MNSSLFSSTRILWILMGTAAVVANLFCLFKLGQALMHYMSETATEKKSAAIQAILLWAPVKLLTLATVGLLFYRMFTQPGLQVAGYICLGSAVFLPFAAIWHYRARTNLHA